MEVLVPSGPCVVVTRPQPQADEWVARLRELGVEAMALPLMCIEALGPESPDLQSAWRDLALAELVMFVSPNAVLRFFAAETASRWPSRVWAAATGPGTAQALRSCGVPPSQIVQPEADSPRFDAETLWAQKLSTQPWRDRLVLVVRGEDGRDWLADTLREAGAEVRAVAAYRRTAPIWDASGLSALGEVSNQPKAVWLFSSSQCIEHLVQAWTPEVAGVARQRPVIATHPRIAQTARQAGFVRVEAVAPDAARIAQAARGLCPA